MQSLKLKRSQLMQSRWRKLIERSVLGANRWRTPGDGGGGGEILPGAHFSTTPVVPEFHTCSFFQVLGWPFRQLKVGSIGDESM